MKKRSPLYPLVNLLNTRNYSINVFEKAGDATFLKIEDLAKFGQIPIRDTDTYSSAAKQYGFMNWAYGKGYCPDGAVCNILRKPQGDEEKQQYLAAFTKPDMYQKIITEYQGKTIPIEGLEIFLIRQHGFSDAGAKQCSAIFLENATFLGLINSEGVFNSTGEVNITITEVSDKPKKTKGSAVTGNTKPVQKNTKTITPLTPPNNNNSSGNPAAKTIMVFIKGQEFNWPVPNNMSQTDWDQLAKQIQQLKSYAG